MIMTKRVISIILAFVLLIGILPLTTAFAYSTGDDYPQWLKDKPLDYYVDPWNYYSRECTSFVAHCLNTRNGVAFHNWYGGVNFGNANSWGNAARSIGITVDMNPTVGSIAWWDGEWGHVAWVESVSGDTVHTEEYNWSRDGSFHERDINRYSVSGYIHFKDIQMDTTAPTGSWNTPINGALYSNTGTINLSVNASDNVSMARVTFHALYDGSWHDLGQDSHGGNGTYSLTWNYNITPQGVLIHAHLYDASNNYKNIEGPTITINPAKPAAPTGLTSTGKTDTTVSLSWNSSAGATSYNVYKGSTKLTSTTAKTYTATGLTQNTAYSFTVKAVNAGGESAASSALNVTTNTTKPSAPTGLTSTGKTDTTVALSWNTVTGATGYNVYKGTTKLTSTPITAKTYTATGLTQNTAYSFTVKAVNAGGESAASASVNVTTNTTKPGAPTSLTSTGKTDTTVDLSWNPVTGATSYNVYNGTTKVTSTTAKTYTVTGLTQNTAYSFTVKAVNAGGESAASSALSVTTNTTKPGVPIGLTSPSKTDTTVDLSWNTVTGATGYNVYNGTTKITSTAANTYTVTGLTQNGSYSFKVTAVNAGGESAASEWLNITTKTVAPTGLTSPSKTDTTVDLSWNTVTVATGYNVYKGATKLTSTPITTKTYTATGLTQNTAYSFTVTAVNAGGESAASSALSVTTNTTKPGAPTGLTSPSKTDTTVDLFWYAVTGSTGYNVYNGATKVTFTPITTNAYTVTGLTQNTAYSFTVTAVNDGGESTASSALVVKTDYIDFTIVDGVLTQYTGAGGNVIIPDSVTSIGGYAFYWCSSLTSITIPDSVTSIGDLAFYECSGLTSVIIPNSVTSIGSYAFSDCSGLTSITIPDSVTSIGDMVFYECSGLTSVIIPNSVTSIGGYAFGECSGLTSVIIPNSVTSIGFAAFYECSGLTSVIIPNSVTSIGGDAFGECSGLTSVIIPNSVTSIGGCAFGECSGLTSVIIGNSVTSIGSYAFCGCSGLTSITIPDSVTSIGGYAFGECSGLTSVIIPNSVTSIGVEAFYCCHNLTIYCFDNSPTQIYAQDNSIPYELIYLSVSAQGPGCVINFANGTITGLPTGITSLEGFFEPASGYELSYVPTANGFGTGTVVNVISTSKTKNAGNIVATYIIVISGDINGDGTVSSIDALMTLQVSSGIASFNEIKQLASDVDNNNSITSVDALKILQYASGIITKF